MTSSKDDKLSRFVIASNVALIACMTAMNLGLPFWRSGPIGDGFDYGVTSFLLCWFALHASEGDNNG